MKRTTKISIALGSVALVGLGAAAAIAQGDHRGGWRGSHHGGEMKRHHGGRMMGHQAGSRKGWHKGRRGHRRFGHLLERFDTDKDGKLTQKELDTSRRALLSKHDTNRDGRLSLKEFESLWLDFKRQRMVRSFQRLDADGDAGITVDEYLKPFSRIVARFDRNADGALSRDDRRMRRWRHHRGNREGGRRGPGGGMREGRQMAPAKPAAPPAKN